MSFRAPLSVVVELRNDYPVALGVTFDFDFEAVRLTRSPTPRPSEVVHRHNETIRRLFLGWFDHVSCLGFGVVPPSTTIRLEWNAVPHFRIRIKGRCLDTNTGVSRVRESSYLIHVNQETCQNTIQYTIQPNDTNADHVLHYLGSYLENSMIVFEGRETINNTRSPPRIDYAVS